MLLHGTSLHRVRTLSSSGQDLIIHLCDAHPSLLFPGVEQMINLQTLSFLPPHVGSHAWMFNLVAMCFAAGTTCEQAH